MQPQTIIRHLQLLRKSEFPRPERTEATLPANPTAVWQTTALEVNCFYPRCILLSRYRGRT
jgi:hypothetical protein